ncbi:hypothetical protein B0I35DRAFT_446351 [Stachybotrys elegans]|uniref:Uncharacterized protein n=1 Tax=Stachybotrys elegans TaxID=80388 RepID=A0A8K0SDT8_9HYPO|nr:hypothetical protein B0I35DRAFT_446351 [Stachybotrys elegans]
MATKLMATVNPRKSTTVDSVMEFINVEHPTDKPSARQKQKVHSHAARVSHAKARRRKGKPRNDDGKDTRGNTSDEPRGIVLMASQKDTSPPVTETFVPGPQNVISPLGYDLMGSFIRSLTPREQFLFHHYITVVFPYLQFHCPLVNSSNGKFYFSHWISLSSAETELLRGFLLASCRHLAIVQSRPDYVQLATEYKLKYIQGLRNILFIDDSRLKGIAVTRAIVLINDEIMLGDLSMASRHLKAVLDIIQGAGGPHAMGLTDFVCFILHKFIHFKRLLDIDPQSSCSKDFMKPDLHNTM